MTKRFKGWAMIMVAAMLLPSLARAQDATASQDIGTGTPPELRDFRLDTPPPRPVVQPSAPQPQPVTASLAPAGSTTPEARTEPRPSTASPGRSNVPPTTRPATGTDNIADPAPATESSPTLPAIAPDTQPESAAIPEAAAEVNGKQGGYYWLAGALAAMGALAAAYFLLRRKRATTEHEQHPAPVQQPSPPARLDQPRRPVPAPARQSDGAAQGPLRARFIPASAQLSIASLTVTGQLRVENATGAAIAGLVLRSHMISAQDGQRAAISAFHANGRAGSIETLGDLDAGSRIDATIEIRLPRNELPSFRWTEREFVAPIVLLHLSGVAGEKPVEVELSQLIGREGDGHAERMKPLPVDRGPKRFTGIAARPVFA